MLRLYDPDRSQALTVQRRDPLLGRLRGQPCATLLAQQKAKSGAGIRILTETMTLAHHGGAVRRHPEALSAGEVASVGAGGAALSARAAPMQAFGAAGQHLLQSRERQRRGFAGLRFSGVGSGAACATRGSSRRGAACAASRREMNRLYVVEPMPTPTGTKADHRLPLRAGESKSSRGRWRPSLGAANGPKQGENHDIYKWVGAIARDLQNNKGACLVIAGEHQPPIVHALAHVMNESLGNVGKTVFYTDPIEANPVDQLASLQDLVKDLDAGAVDLLLIVGGNPVFNAPVEIGHARSHPRRRKLRAHLGLYARRDQQVCQWHLPEAHYLETWGDARAFDGTVTIQQPLIQPLYGGRSAYQILQMLTEQAGAESLRNREGILGDAA